MILAACLAAFAAVLAPALSPPLLGSRLGSVSSGSPVEEAGDARADSTERTPALAPDSSEGGRPDGAGAADASRARPIEGPRLEVLPPLAPGPVLGSFVPEALATDELGRLFVLDRSRGRIFRVSETGEWLPFAAGGQGGDRFAQYSRIFAGWGPDLFALDPADARLYHFDLDGHLRTTIRYGGESLERELGFLDPVDFLITKSGELILLDRAGDRLLLFDRFGAYVTDLMKGVPGRNRPRSPARLGQDPGGNHYVLDPPTRRVLRFSRQGEPGDAWSFAEGLPETATEAGHLVWMPRANGASEGTTPWSVARGPGRIVVAARDLSWIRVYAEDGVLLLAEDAPFGEPHGVADMVAASHGTLFLSQPDRARILRLRLHESHGAPREDR